MRIFLLWFIALFCTAPLFVQAEDAVPPETTESPAIPGEAKFGVFIPQLGFGESEAQELFEVVATRAAAELGYEIADPLTSTQLPPPPDDVRDLGVLVRNVDGGIRFVQMGCRLYGSQPLHLWIFGRTVPASGAPKPNPELAEIQRFVADARKSYGEELNAISIADLDHKKIDLSYVEPSRCLDMLKMLGFTVVTAGEPIAVEALPTIVAIPSTEQHDLLPGTEPGQSFMPAGSDPMHDLLVFYHPSRPEQYAQVLHKVRSLIDVPARQIVIEVLVLEIGEVGLQQLGIEWELQSPVSHFGALKVGRLPAFAEGQNAIPTLDTQLRDIFGYFSTKIQALIRDGKAEVLSRPSVTTLDNRMAYINVEERIPVVTSITNPSSSTVTVNFKEVKAGITLNVRPRISADLQEISMQVAASVTARVPNEDVVVRTSNGEEAARSPTISARLVKTRTRVPNNTPFIIGGLVSNDLIDFKDKVPLLSDIPLIGNLLFTTRRIEREKREVIIVVTPRLLPETELASPALPEDKDAFDSFGDKLFRDAYRIRAEDVFDLGFLKKNKQLQRMQNIADLLVQQDASLSSQYPFDRFSDGRIPGERIIVFRQMYEVIKRLKLESMIDPSQIIFFRPDPESQSGFTTTFLSEYLAEVSNTPQSRGKEPDYASIFENLDGLAVALTYTVRRYDSEATEILSQPVPQVHAVACPNEETWSRLLWEMNQPDRHGQARHTVLLRNEKDMVRLKRALILKRTVALNAGDDPVRLSKFHLGRMLLMPTLKEEKIHVMDSDAAKYFFFTEQYYPALKLELARDLDIMVEALQLPEIRDLLPDGAYPLRPIEWQPR